MFGNAYFLKVNELLFIQYFKPNKR